MNQPINSTERKSTLRRFAGKGVFPHQYAFTLLIPLRNFFLSPKELIKRIELKKNSAVLELGPGPGYFSAHIAEALTGGELYLYDIQKEMLEYARKRLNKRNLKNVEYVQASGESFPFESNFFDIVFMVTVLGEVENKKIYLKELHRTIKSTGLVSVSELAGDPDKMTREEIIDLFTANGFEFRNEHIQKRNFTINFKKCLADFD